MNSLSPSSFCSSHFEIWHHCLLCYDLFTTSFSVSFFSSVTLQLLKPQHLIETLVLTAPAAIWLPSLSGHTHPGSLAHTFLLACHPNPVRRRIRSHIMR